MRKIISCWKVYAMTVVGLLIHATVLHAQTQRQEAKTDEFRYKTHAFYVEPFFGKGGLSEEKLEEHAGLMWPGGHDFKCEVLMYGLTSGWLFNLHTNVAINPINVGVAFGSQTKQALLSLYATTGVMIRTNPLARKGRFVFYFWPTIGWRAAKAHYKYKSNHYVDFGGTNQKTKEYKEGDSYSRNTLSNISHLDWNLRAGVTLDRHLSIGVSYNDLYWAGLVTIYF